MIARSIIDVLCYVLYDAGGARIFRLRMRRRSAPYITNVRRLILVNYFKNFDSTQKLNILFIKPWRLYHISSDNGYVKSMKYYYIKNVNAIFIELGPLTLFLN